ncbi:MAG: epoxyqueuosine reductase [Clostridiales bacterium]|jgi:epoxyqueuosine reductase QueG|nr:epoxyqueuosine reductase [Clostridiales bacterium]
MEKCVINTSLPYGVCGFEQVAESTMTCAAASRLPRGAQSVISVLFPYYLGEKAYEGSNLSRYAVVRDYHSVAGEYLEMFVYELKHKYPEADFAAFCDNSPIPEVDAAQLAGLGVKGRNGLLISPVYGSWVFIGVIVTDIAFERGTPSGGCASCGRCVESCPSGALSASGFDRKVCLSAVTQRKGELSEAEKTLIRDTGCIWGCDICQLACPMNKGAAVTPVREFRENAICVYDGLQDISGRAFAWRGRAVIQRNLDILGQIMK